MTTIAQIQHAMGPVYMAWANLAVDHHFTQAAEPPTTSEHAVDVRARKIMDHLAEHGPSKGKALREMLECNQKQWDCALKKLGPQVLSERVGGKYDRYAIYWLPSNPPPTSQRSTRHQVTEFVRENPGATIDEINVPSIDRDEVVRIAHILCRTGVLVMEVKSDVNRYRVAA